MNYDTGHTIDSRDPGGVLFSSLGGRISSIPLGPDTYVLGVSGGVLAFIPGGGGGGSGTVTSVDVSVANGLTVSGNPITTSGTLAFGISAGGIANVSLANSAITIAGTSTSLGGSITLDAITGVSSNGYLKRTGANTLTNVSSIPNGDLANSSITINGQTVALGASGTLTLASSDFANQGTTTTVLHGNAAGNPSFGQIVTSDITANAVTYAKMQAISGSSLLLGSSSTGTAVTEITLGTGLSLSGTTLTATGSGGTVTNVTGTSPIASSGGATPAISIADAVADGSTKGAASFTAADFNSSSGNISLDYTNGQKASASQPGFLSAADWTTFNTVANSWLFQQVFT